MADCNTQTAAVEIRQNLDILAREAAFFASRMKYLAMAANSIAGGSTPSEPERSNCVASLLDTLEYLGGMMEGAAENLEQSARRVMEGGRI